MKATFYKDDEVRRLLADFVLNRNVLSMGSEVRTFEEVFSVWQKRRYSVMLNSGSSANLVLIQALLNEGILNKGDRVGVSALTWATNVMPLIQLGLVPVVIDINLDTLNVSLDLIKKVVEGIDCLFITNALGFSDDLVGIRSYCERNKILLLEDNCESLGSIVNGVKLGNFGLASTFSFFVGHHLSTIEGGIVCTDDKDLYEQLLMVRSHGWDRGLGTTSQINLREKNSVDDFYSKYTFYDLAYNLRPTDIQGFLGKIQIKYLDEIVLERESNYNRLNLEITNNQDLVKLNLKHMDRISNFCIPIITKSKLDFLIYKKLFEANGVEIRPIISGNIAQQPFFKKYLGNSFVLKNAEMVHEQGFYFTNRPDLDEQDLELLVNLIRK